MPSINDYINRFRKGLFADRTQLSGIAFIDLEVALDGKCVHDYGAMKEPDNMFHASFRNDFAMFVADAEFLCGHNIINHDLKYMVELKGIGDKKVIDTLYLSPLLFPKRPYHKLLNDDKLQTEEVNNPLNDCLKARDLFYDEVNAFYALPSQLKRIFCCLLYRFPEFKGFFDYVKLQQHAYCVLSDSGTIPEESAILNFPGVSMRNSTERPEALDAGSIVLGSVNERDLINSIELAVAAFKNNRDNPVRDYRDTNVSEKVCRIIQSYYNIVNERTWKK